MPEDMPEEIDALVSWCYTGQLTDSFSAEELWVLGDRFRCAGLSNEAMYFMFDLYHLRYITSKTAAYVYANTCKGSRLRNFVKDLIINEGPLHVSLNDPRPAAAAFRDDWIKQIELGGELVVDIVLNKSSFSSNDDEGFPYLYDFRDDYIEPLNTRPIEDFLKGK